MKTDQLLSEDKLLKPNSYDCFFGVSNFKKRLRAIDEWTDLPFIKRDFTGKHQPHTLLCQHNTMLKLLNDSFAFHQRILQGNHELAELISMEPHEVKLEGEILGYQPEYLGEEEMCNPDLYLCVLNGKETLTKHQEYLHLWLSINLSESTDENVGSLIFSMSKIMKQLTEAS